LDSTEDLIEVAMAGDVAEEVGPAAVEGDIDAPYPRCPKIAREQGEAGAVGRQGELVETVADPLAEPADQLFDVAADERLPPPPAGGALTPGQENAGEV